MRENAHSTTHGRARYYSFQPFFFHETVRFFFLLFLSVFKSKVERPREREREWVNIKIVPNDQRISNVYNVQSVYIEMLDDESRTIDKIRLYYIDKLKHMQRYYQRYWCDRKRKKQTKRALQYPFTRSLTIDLYRKSMVWITKQQHLFYVQKLCWYALFLSSIAFYF